MKCNADEIEAPELGAGVCVKRKAWMDSLSKHADNPMYIFSQMKAIEKELLTKDHPDLNYLKGKARGINLWLDEIDKFHKQ